MISHPHSAAAAHVARLIAVRTGQKAAPPRPWSELEERLYDALRLFLLNEALGLSGNVLDAGDPTYADDGQWWTDHAAGLLNIFRRPLETIARLGATVAQSVVEPVIGVNWGLVNRHAVEWAAQHAANLVTRVTPVTREAVRQVMAEWARSGEPLSKLAERIEGLSDPQTGSVFSPRRAETIAQTESTTAYAEGNARAWEAAGIAPAAFKPAGHINCRCYLQPWKQPDGARVMVWFTAKDDLVCTRKIATPWGDVNGCRELHLTVVSAGPWLGQKRSG